MTPLKWRQASLPPALVGRYEGRLAAILDSWKGTPYMLGQQCRGEGVDCVRFVCAVLDEFFRRPPTPIKTLPPDAALHTREGAIAAMRKIRELYMPNEPIEDGTIEPGDVLVTGPSSGGPGHAMIVGPDRQVWHASTHGSLVTYTGTVFPADMKVFRVYRMVDRSVAC